MKLYTEEQLLNTVKAVLEYDNEVRIQKHLKALAPIELPSDEKIVWNIEKPKHIDNYIVDRGAEGVSLGWWNGNEWIKMWGSEKINVYGWIKIPLHKERILNQNK